MRDTGVLIALVLGTIAAGILFFYAWPVKNENKMMSRMLYAIAAMLSFCWVSFGWMWFSV
jgi:CHASE2 domain-containing sensor protein